MIEEEYSANLKIFKQRHKIKTDTRQKIEYQQLFWVNLPKWRMDQLQISKLWRKFPNIWWWISNELYNAKPQGTQRNVNQNEKVY